MNEQDYKEYQDLINEGHSQRSAAKILGIDRCKIQRYIKKQLECEDIIETLTNKPKILFYDIETTLAKSYHYVS